MSLLQRIAHLEQHIFGSVDPRGFGDDHPKDAPRGDGEQTKSAEAQPTETEPDEVEQRRRARRRAAEVESGENQSAATDTAEKLDE